MTFLRSSLFVLATLLSVAAVQQTNAQALRPGADGPSLDILNQQLRNLDRQRYQAPAAKGAAMVPGSTFLADQSRILGSLAGDPSPGADNGWGYTWYDSSEHVALMNQGFLGLNINGLGDELLLSDDEAEIVTMGFEFGFYGQTYSQVTVCSNGFLSFTSTACPSFGELGSNASPNAVVAGYWTDLDPSAGGSIETLMTTDGPTGMDVFVAQWTDVPLSASFGIPEPATYSFQIRLYQDGEIRFVYPFDFFEQVNAAIGIESNDVSSWLDIHEEFGGSYPFLGLNDEIIIQPPTGASGLIVGPRQDLEAGLPVFMSFVTEPCGSQPSRVQEFIVYNNSSTTLSTGVMSLSGDPEFELLTPGSISIPAGGEAFVRVAFKGLPNSGGTVSAPAYKGTTLTIPNADWDVVYIAGNTIETTVSPHERDGGGYSARSSVVGCNSAPAPPAALVPFGLASGDELMEPSFSRPDSLTLATPFRLYGEPYSKVYVNNSGAVTFEKWALPGILDVRLPPSGGQRTAFAGAAVFGYYDFGTSTAASRIPGTAYAGNRDVTGDGIADLVVTFYRVPTIFSSYAYATWQMVLSPSATPGQNGTIRYQYFAGTDPSDGKPYSAGYDTSWSLNYRGVAGVSGDQRSLYTETRSRAYLAWALMPAMFDEFLGGVAYELTPRSERVEGASGPNLAGWRLLSAPASGMTVADLAEQNLVQGLPSSYPTAGGNPVAANIFTRYDAATGYTAPADTSTALAPGEGIYWYLFNLDILPDVGGPGESQSYLLPAPLVAAGTRTSGTVNVPLTAVGDGGPVRWEMVGNPFEFPLDVSGMASWGAGGSLGSAVGQLWDPADGTYVMTTAVGDELAVWDGMFIEGGTATSLNISVPASTRSTSVARELLTFALSGTDLDGKPTLDRAAAIEISDEASEAWDLRDASKLEIDGASATIAFVGKRGEDRALKAQESRPFGAPFSVPMTVGAVGVESEVTLSWSGLPSAASAVLVDNVAGEVLSLKEAGSYTFSVEPRSLDAGRSEFAGPPTPKVAAAPAEDGTARFTLNITPSRAVATEGPSDATHVVSLELSGANPISSAAQLRVSTPEAAFVQIDVLDVMGRRVARIQDGEVAAGSQMIRWDASGVAAGTYVVRAQIGAEVRTVKVMVLQ